MPPSVVLEVLRILKAETDLRQRTRTTEPLRDVVGIDEYAKQAGDLLRTQTQLRQRTEAVIRRVNELQGKDGADFAKDRERLLNAEHAMQDAVNQLGIPETGPATIAAQTEAIEALLATRRGGQQRKGGGGNMPGGNRTGGSTDRHASALSGIGEGLAAEDRFTDQSSGAIESPVPVEYRAELDAYFNALEGS